LQRSGSPTSLRNTVITTHHSLDPLPRSDGAFRTLHPSLLLLCYCPLATTRPYYRVIVQPGPQLLVELVRRWTEDAEAVPPATHSGIGEETLLLGLVPERRQAATPAPSVGVFALSLTS
jgi:hypothetical protein